MADLDRIERGAHARPAARAGPPSKEATVGTTADADAAATRAAHPPTQMETERDEAIAAVDEHTVAARLQQEAAEASIADLREQVRALGEEAREEAAEARGEATVLREQLAREREAAASQE